MSDQHRTVGEAAASGGGSAAASPDAASVEAHLTGRKPSTDPLTASAPASGSAASPSAKKPANPPAEKKVPLPGPSEAATPKAKERKAAAAGGSSDLPTVLTRVLLQNNTNNTCVDVPGFSNGSADGPVIHAECNGTTADNQLWNVEKKYGSAGPGGVPLFQIRNVKDSLCLDLSQYGARPGATKVQEFPCNGTTADNQLWWLDKQADGKYWIRNFASRSQCLDSYANDQEDKQLIIWPCAPENSNNHEWSFTRR